MSPEFAALVARFADRPKVERPGGGPRRFGADTLRVGGSIFAMEVGGRLVVKLPAARVRELIEEGVGGPFRSGTGSPMREWLSLPLDTTAVGLVEEACAFVDRQ